MICLGLFFLLNVKYIGMSTPGNGGLSEERGVILPDTGGGALGMVVAIISGLLSSFDTKAHPDLSDFLLGEYNKVVQFRRTAYSKEELETFTAKLALEILAELMKPENRAIFESLDTEILARLINYASSVIPSDLRLITHKDLNARAHSTQAITLAYLLTAVPSVNAVINMSRQDPAMLKYGLALIVSIVALVTASTIFLNYYSAAEYAMLNMKYRELLIAAGPLTKLMPGLTVSQADVLLRDLLILMGRGVEEA